MMTEHEGLLFEADLLELAAWHEIEQMVVVFRNGDCLSTRTVASREDAVNTAGAIALTKVINRVIMSDETRQEVLAAMAEMN